MNIEWNMEEEPLEEQLLDEPTVRPYVMTRGRTDARGRFDLISVAVTVLSVAEIAAHLDLPAGTVRVLLGDLLDRGFIAVQQPQPETSVLDERMYRAVLDGLRAL